MWRGILDVTVSSALAKNTTPDSWGNTRGSANRLGLQFAVGNCCCTRTGTRYGVVFVVGCFRTTWTWRRHRWPSRFCQRIDRCCRRCWFGSVRWPSLERCPLASTASAFPPMLRQPHCSTKVGTSKSGLCWMHRTAAQRNWTESQNVIFKKTRLDCFFIDSRFPKFSCESNSNCILLLIHSRAARIHPQSSNTANTCRRWPNPDTT